MNLRSLLRSFSCLLVLPVVVGSVTGSSYTAFSTSLSDQSSISDEAVISAAPDDFPPAADAGLDFSVPPGYPARFFGSGATPTFQVLTFQWDFDADGTVDYSSRSSAMTTHVYSQPGVYTAILTVSDALGQATYDSLTVTVDPQAREQIYHEAVPQRIEAAMAAAAADGAVEQFAVMINGSGETRFWDDVTFMYTILVNDYQFNADRIYLLNNTGTDPWGGNPDGMIDQPATLESLDIVFNELAERVDGDDHLFIWVTDHGSGYIGNPNDPSYGHLSTSASVDPGDEMDYLERDFVLQAMYLDRFFTYYTYYSQDNTYTYVRVKHISRFTNLLFEALGVRSDSDVMVERLYDYLLGDFNRDGSINQAAGEIIDFDGDGNMPYDPATGAFDEDDWGPFDTYDDPIMGVSWLSTAVPGGPPYALFDAGFDGTLDIDLSYRGGTPTIDGTDLDGDARFDFLDVNEDGDLDDWVSIDEELSLAGWYASDDQIAELVDRVGAGMISVFMLPCFSGGFIDDLSAANRVISTATGEEAYSYGNLFTDLFASAFHRSSRSGLPVDADVDDNGEISMLEAFNYAAANDYYSETPQYDDNGDGIGHPYPVPNGGDGGFGAGVYLRASEAISPLEIDIQPNNRSNTINIKLSQKVPVAILSVPGFDAPSRVERASLTFGRSGNENSLVFGKPGVTPACSSIDVNQDGRLDLVCYFAVKKTGFVCGDTLGHLRGTMLDGLRFEADDKVNITPCWLNKQSRARES